MEKVNKSVISLLALILAPAIVVAQERVGDFSLLDQDGYHHGMSWYDDHKAIALLVQANDSDATTAAIPAFNALKEKFEEAGIEFLMINPMGRNNRAAVQAKVAEYDADIPVLMDDARVVSQALGIERTGEVLIYDPKRFTVEFKGSVAAAETAIGQILAEETVSPALVETSGSAITYAAQATPSYVADIAPVLAEQCATCHREGGVAPFAMDSHTMVQGWSPMIREVLMTRRMPPGQIDGHIGEFINDRLVDTADIRNIIAWVDAGAPKDGDHDPLAELVWPESKWAFGEPDMILDIPPTTVPATGNGVFVNVEVTFDMPEDRWLRGSQIIAGDRTVLHHTVNRLDFPGEDNRRGFLGGSGNRDKASITAYIPGDTPDLDPPNTGGLVKAGSVLHLNMHYTPNGRETTDHSQLGVWFYPLGEVPEERMSGECACVFPNTWTTIPAQDPNFEQTASIVIENDAHIHSYLPHMHFRGKYMRFYADYPDGSSEELINIAKYNYNWQLSYTYEEPKFVPGGTRITAVAAWDNSPQNPANPNPDRNVDWGNESWDEMFFGAVSWKDIDQGGED
ncbi:MAG: redoxin domain-containing protein [Gammaproteobacteria bacterium]|nr:redoxin domain-containing protein [Gammaproteobacteria bacterium]MDD9894327.1 redoxin domain-containing protein [Gammaproteobacteria bacterium]MDD9957648.1 redoxin domain-containing protein [Gammaproteobacteria bacterium]